MKPFKEKDEYFCIKLCWEKLYRKRTGDVGYRTMGLGTDDKVYYLSRKGWLEFRV